MRFEYSSLALFAGISWAASLPNTTNFEQETRSLDEIYQAALAEGGVVTLWHGGDEKTQQNSLKSAFEARFPNMTLNVTVDLSKYHDVNLDAQLAADNVYVDSIILQTLHDYPRWKKQGALMNYAPLNFDKIYPVFKDAEAAYSGLLIFDWGISANMNKTSTMPTSYQDFTKPEYKDKIVLTYPNDDDAVLYQFELIIEELGEEWFNALLANNPRWVRGTATPGTLIKASNSSSAVTFSSGYSFADRPPVKYALPSDAKFVSWAQTGAILKKAPHPEGAKLLHSFMLSDENQSSRGWSVREDIPAPEGAETILQQPGTDAPAFAEFMADRGHVERRRDFYEVRIGTAQGLSPLIDDLLFNNPALSDVKIKQIHEGHTREYYAHKAVLCLESDYFLNAFTGNFKEASEGIMELHEDDPEHFEFLLKFMYTGAYNKHEIAKLAGDDKIKRVLVPVGVHAIADKYDVAKLYEPAAEDVKAVLVEAAQDREMLITAIRAHYGTEVNVDGAMGRLITSVVLENHQDLLRTKDFEQLLLAHPTFAADVALNLQRNALSALTAGWCIGCRANHNIDAAGMRKAGCTHFYCPRCSRQCPLPAVG
ncbi:uncharacterized protein J4E92_000073 [Alternaria infectoria]|uniref:uncharacterized protein n=1 Tax=Alternaria infectoria TaxID=45303 RepID=UPI00221FA3C0|nr:uncharacterized protein J4E92_000073 [Alternaria infectoria]KAI4938792.1 hypothetical protein J4E92_000073 [Alternaria infectoria]